MADELDIVSSEGKRPDDGSEGFKIAPGDPTPTEILRHRIHAGEIHALMRKVTAALVENGDDAWFIVSVRATLRDEVILARYLIFPSVDGATRIERRGEHAFVKVSALAFLNRVAMLQAMMRSAVEAYAHMVTNAEADWVLDRVRAARRASHKGGSSDVERN